MNFRESPFLVYVKKFPRPFFLGMFLLLITNILDASWPMLLKIAIDQVQNQVSFSELSQTVLFYFVILFCLSWTRYGWRSIFGGFHTWAQEDLRKGLFGQLMKLGFNYLQKGSVGEILSYLTNDIQAFRQGIGPGVLMLVDAVIIVCSVIPAMLYLNVGWTLKVLIFIPLIPVLIWRVMKLIQAHYKIQQEEFTKLTGICQETIAGIRVIKSFVQEQNRLKVFNNTSRLFEFATNRLALVDSLFVPIMEIGVAAGSVILIFIAKDDVLSGLATIGSFVAFQRYIAKMIWPMTALGLGFSYVQKGRASYQRIQGIMKLEPDIVDSGQIDLKNFESLEFKNVSFKFENSKDYILKNVSFCVKKTEFLGITGPVGSGKSVLLHLCLRLYPLTEGQILINQIDIEKYTLESLRRKLIFIPSEPFLFSDSIKENILFGVPQSLQFENEIQKINEALHAVSLDAEIDHLPHKVDSQLGERGINLSGGQKQRMTLARGLILPGEVILMDDVMSAVDVKTEARIEKVLSESQITRILVSHRLKALQSADRILVLNDGRVESIGNSQELLKNSKCFRTLVEIQNDKPESEVQKELLQ
jgi:ATP-binding cassette subfamily B protein